jgi:hypothetical protein
VKGGLSSYLYSLLVTRVHLSVLEVLSTPPQYSLQGTGKGGAKFVDSYYLETYYLGRLLAGLGGLWRTPRPNVDIAINSID